MLSKEIQDDLREKSVDWNGEEMVRKMESVMATIEVLADKECMDSIEKSEEDIKAGRVYSTNNEKNLENLLGVKDTKF